MKKKINVFDYSQQILEALQKGILLTTKSDKVNSMVISWGTLGIEWSVPMFTVFVREHRFTREQLEKNPEFTINIPVGNYDSNIMKLCGTKSGHDIDKIQELGLTLEDPTTISVPGIKELPLTLECKVVYSQLQKGELMHCNEYHKKYYPQNVDSTFCGANKDYHIAYYGEIVDAYLIQP